MPEAAVAVIVVLAGYLIGSVPVPYLAGRLLKGVDIRQAGSANVGASNVWRMVSKPAVVPVGLAAIAQGAVAVGIAKLASQGLAVQSLAGIAALVGHNWCVWLRFQGGRGIGTAIGLMLMLSWPALATFTAVSLAGVAIRSIPLAVGLGIALAPVAALVAGQATAIVLCMAGMAVAVFAKRLLSNELAPPGGMAWREVLANRLVFDRDVRDREAWVSRGRRS